MTDKYQLRRTLVFCWTRISVSLPPLPDSWREIAIALIIRVKWTAAKSSK